VRRILEAGFYVSFTGNVTYEQGRLGVAGEVPLEKLLLETDSPLITPEPLRGQRNEPMNVRLIAKAHSLARGVGLEEIERVTSENAHALFNF
jgi:TatD DNase family protein